MQTLVANVSVTHPSTADKLPSLPDLNPAQDAVVERWYTSLSSAMTMLGQLESRLIDCTSRCSEDCPSDGFHDAASDKFNRAYRLILDVAAAMSNSEVPRTPQAPRD